MDLIERTWAELGVKGIRPLRRTLFVRTVPPATMTMSGRLWLPPKQIGFYGVLPHLRIVKGTVLAAGKDCSSKPGDYVCFQRLHFARWEPVQERDAYVGWIDESQLVGSVLDEEHPPPCPEGEGYREMAQWI